MLPLTFSQVQQLEDRSRRNIQKSRPYFEEKQICQDQLQTQKERIQELQLQIQTAKYTYATSLKNLEQISEDIHRQRGDLSNAAPSGPRQPGVGAELSSSHPQTMMPKTRPPPPPILNANVLPLPDYASELAKCECPSLGHTSSINTSSAVSEKGDNDSDDDTNDFDLEQLRQKVKVLAVRPVEGGDGQQTQDVWESELNDTVNKLDRLMMIRESAAAASTTSMVTGKSISAATTTIVASMPSSPVKKSHTTPVKMLKKTDPPSSANVSMKELPLLARISNEIAERAQKFQRKRRLSLE